MFKVLPKISKISLNLEKDLGNYEGFDNLNLN